MSAPRWVRRVGAALLGFGAAACSAALLPAPAPDAAPLLPPVSSFHDRQPAEAEARQILASWAAGEAVTLPWTRLQLERYVRHKAMPTRGARGLALVHVAMHDAYERAVQQQLEPKLAVSMAAAQVLAYLFPAEERAFDRTAFELAAQLSAAPREQLPAGALDALRLGRAVGQRAIERGESDGAQRGWNGVRLQWHGEGRYYGPGSWEPTPPYFYYPPDEPFAPSWKPWVLDRADRFRRAPPAFHSARFLADLREVVAINRSLTPEQLRVAKFWVDGHGTVTPPGHWNQIAIEEARRARLDDATTVRLFADLNLALADTFIAVWDTKYRYWTQRPITAAKKLLNVTLKPPILTPPFPSYVSGHAAFSGAAARILGHYFPAEAARLDALAEEAAASRLYGGIHFRHDNEDGLALGRKVAEFVLNNGKP
ncbi:MAG: vanadium-dependent haloperoxidase [Rhodanobacteraceae bacterium]|nr:vanadium-dependent haloperoxidase [Rhodanobacteraceae bacterium]